MAGTRNCRLRLSLNFANELQDRVAFLAGDSAHRLPASANGSLAPGSFVYAPMHQGSLQLVELLCSNTWAWPEYVIRELQQEMLDELPVNVSVGAVEAIQAHPLSPAAS